MMARVERIGDATLMLGDCREILPTLGGVQAIVTDPPYGVKFRGASWDAEIPEGWLEIARACAPLVMFTTAPTTLWDYPRPDWVANWYRPASSSRTKFGGFNHWSPIAIYGRPKMPVDCVYLNALQHSYEPGEILHESPKPIALAEWMVSRASDEGDTIADGFAGSGTTGVACARLGRRFIGIEIEHRYFDIACRRIEAAYRQRDLFIEPPAAKPEQLTMEPR